LNRWVSAGRVGKLHGRDGSFYVERPDHLLPEGTVVRVGHRELRVARRAGTDERPLVRLDGIADRTEAAAVRGEPLLVAEADSPLADGEWLAGDLVGCEVPGLGRVRQVLAAPSCDVLEVGEARTLVPLVRDAVRRIDVGSGVIEVDLEFLRGPSVGEEEGTEG
jgi:16S rRNA processing protein RimM